MSRCNHNHRGHGAHAVHIQDQKQYKKSSISNLFYYTWLSFLAVGDLLGHAGEAVGFFIYLINIMFKNAGRTNLLSATIFLQAFALLLAFPDARTCWRAIVQKNKSVIETESTPLLPTVLAPGESRHASRFASFMSMSCCRIDWFTNVVTPIKEFFSACGVLITYALFWETFHCGFGKNTDFDVSVGALILSAPMTALIFLASLCCHYYLNQRSNRPRELAEEIELSDALTTHTPKISRISRLMAKSWRTIASASKEMFGGIKTFVGYESLFRVWFDYEKNSSFGISTEAAIPAAIIAVYATLGSMIFHVQFNHLHEHASVPQACNIHHHSFFWQHLRKVQGHIRVLDLYGHASEVMDAGAYLLYSGLQVHLPEWAFITVMTFLLILSFVLALPDNNSCAVNLQELVAEEDLFSRGGLLTTSAV